MKTILLIHGWDYDNYYHRVNGINAWHNREKFTKSLEEKYNVILINLPGFGITSEPKEKSWSVSDFAKYVNDYISANKLKVDYILGYSFGGAVAIKYKLLYNKKTKLILISPAIMRINEKSKKFIETPKILEPLRKFLRNLYVTYKLKTPEMVYGTKFLKNTYQNIVREDSLKDLETFNKQDIIFIFGQNDTMVSYNELKKDQNNNVKILLNGTHDIANTNTYELVTEIAKFIS